MIIWDRIIVPVSGGKDSQVVLSIALKTYPKERIEPVHQFTGFDHSLTYRHLKYMEEFYGIKIKNSKSSKYKDLFDMIKQLQYFPNSLARACTGRLKITPFAQWLEKTNAHKVNTLVLLGMRAGESAARAEKYNESDEAEIFSICDISDMYPKRIQAVKCQLPIVSRSTSWVFEYLRKEGAKINPLYAKGHKRVGCYPCLLAGDTEWQLAARDNEGRMHIQKLLDIEKEFIKNKDTNTRKLIRIHETRDIQKLLKDGAKTRKNDPFGFDEDDGSVGCSWCNY